MPDCGTPMLWCADAVQISFTLHADVFSVAQRQNHIMNSFADYLTRCGGCSASLTISFEVRLRLTASEWSIRPHTLNSTCVVQQQICDVNLRTCCCRPAPSKPQMAQPNCMCSPPAVTGEDSVRPVKQSPAGPHQPASGKTSKVF